MASVEAGASRPAISRREASSASLARYMLTPVETTTARPEEAGAGFVHVRTSAPIAGGGCQLQSDLVNEHMGRGINLDVHRPPEGDPHRRGLGRSGLCISHGRPSSRSLLGRALEAPDAPVGVADGHLPGPEMGLRDIGDHLDRGTGPARGCIGHLPHELQRWLLVLLVLLVLCPLVLLVLWDLGNEDVGPAALRSWPEAWSVSNSSLNPSAWKNLAALPRL